MTEHQIVVDRDLCEGQLRCEAVAPEVFKVSDDDNQTHVIVERIESDQIENVQRALMLCPRGALSWRSDPGRVR